MKQWKRLAALSSAIVMAAATLTYFPNDTLQNIRLEISASAEDASAVTWTKTESDGLTWTLYEDGTLNISGTGEMRGYNAYSIKSPACDNSNIKNVVIEDGITSIGSFAFYGCSLTNIRIPGSVTSIGKYALDYCMSLTSVTIPGSVSSIGEYAFIDCRNLTDATILDGVTSIENRAFWGCSRLTSVTIPNSVTNIGESAFWHCSELTSVTIPDGVTSIEDYVFNGCYSLTSITIPNSVTSIGNYVFDGCSSLTSITIPDGVISIGNFAFSGCNELTSITIPDSVTSIGDSAFEECRILTSISIPDSVTSIGSSVFNDCFFLETISLSCKSTLKRSDFEGKSKFVSYTPHTLKKVEVKAETCTENGNKEYWTCEHCGKYFLSDDTNPETAKAVELSETVISASHKLTKVEAKAPTCTEDGNKEYWTCEHCGKYFLSDDANPETAKAVEQSEFIIPALNHKNAIIQNASEPTETAPGYSGDRYCPDCDTVFEKGYTYWNEGNLTWKLYEDGTLNISGTGAMKDYNDDDNPSPVYQNSNVKKVVIEKGVTSIGNYAFSGCLGLKSITIPDGITSIGDHAFDSCINLRSITLPDSITSIGMWAFYNCWNVSSIIIPDGVTSIEDFTFNSCISLTSITIPNSVTNIKSSAFHNCADLTSITIPDSVTSIGYAAFSNCDSLQTISLGCGSALKKSDFGDQADLVSYTNQHFLTKTEAKAKTCTEDGNKEYWTCEHCGKYFLSDDTNPETAKAVEQSETIIPASHELTKVEAKDATCTESGNKEYWTCEHCGKYFLSDDTNPETAKAVELSETILPAIQHKNAELRNASEPTETSPGYSGDLYCPDCDKVLEKGYTYWNEGNLTWKLDADGTLTISGTGAMKDYDYYYNNPSPAYNNSNVKKVVIEDGVTSIGNSAFYNCDGLTSITIPKSVTSIENYAFYNCTGLTSITIPDSVTSIGDSVFEKCSNLSNITLSNNITSIESGAFADCSSLTDIVIPNSVTSIGDFAFDWCSNLSSITLSNNITSIGTFAFNGCSSLTSITIPDSVTSIGSFAFNHCNSLQTISLGCGSALKRSDFGKQGDFVSYASHILKKTAAKAATCTEDGNKEYWTCEHCGKYFLSDDTNPETAKAVEQSETVIPASHKLTKVDAKDATCSESGNKEYWTCEHCGKYFLSDDANPETAKAVELSETVIPASHKLTKVEAKDATCTENGNKAYWTCEHCKKYFLSDDTNPETAKAVEQSETVIPASHKLTKVEAKAATCTEDGNIEYWTCEHCKKYFLSDDTNPETATAVELSETVIPALVQIATTTTPIKCVYGQDMSKIDLRDYVKNTDVVGEVTVKVATGSTLPDGMKLDGSKLSGKPAKAYEDGKEVTFTFTAENGSTANLTLLFLVAKADPTVEVSVSGDSHTEGDLVGELELILSENSTKGVVKLVSEIKALVAGKNAFTWKFMPEDENNYHTVTGTVVVNAQTTTTTTTTTKATTTTTKATTTTKPSKTTTTNATTTTKPSKTTTTNATTTTKPSKTTTTKVTTTTKPNKTTTTKATTTTKPSKTTTTNATTTTKPSKTTTTKVTTTTKPSKATTTKVTTTTTTAIPSYGDVNLDGKVDIVDAIFLNKYLATLIQFSDAQVANADCYQDGVLNDQDTTALMQFIILLIDDLPVQPTEK